MTRTARITPAATLLASLVIIGLVTVPAATSAGAAASDCAIPAVDDRCEAWVSVVDASAPGEGYEEPYAMAASATRVYATGVGGGAEADHQVTSAFDAATGSNIWKASLPGEPGTWNAGYAIDQSPDDPVVYVAGERGFQSGDAAGLLVARDSADGHVLWTNVSDDAVWWGRMAISQDGTIYVLGQQSSSDPDDRDLIVAAHDPETGDRVWTTVYGGPANGWDYPTGMEIDSSGDRIFVLASLSAPDGSDDDAILAFDTAGPGPGSLVWSAIYNGGSGGASSLTIAPNGSRVIVTGSALGSVPDPHGVLRSDYVTEAYDADTGARQWLARHDGPLHFADFAYDAAVSPDGKSVFVTGASYPRATITSPAGPVPTRRDFGTVAYDAATGEEQWVSTYSGPGDSDDSGYLIQVHPDGDQLFVGGWSRSNGHDWVDSITVALDTQTGIQRWVARLGAFASDLPWSYPNDMVLAPDGGRLFGAGLRYGSANPRSVVPDDWHLYAYDL